MNFQVLFMRWVGGMGCGEYCADWISLLAGDLDRDMLFNI